MNKDRKSRPKVLLVNRALVLDEKNKILIIQRSKDDAFMPSKWEFPGGKLDAGQDITNALEREVLEETGLVVTPIEKIAYWHSKIIASGRYKGMPYIELTGITKSIGGTVRLSHEHDAFAWVTVEQALEYDLVPESRTALTVLSNKL